MFGVFGQEIIDDISFDSCLDFLSNSPPELLNNHLKKPIENYEYRSFDIDSTL